MKKRIWSVPIGLYVVSICAMLAVFLFSVGCSTAEPATTGSSVSSPVYTVQTTVEGLFSAKIGKSGLTSIGSLGSYTYFSFDEEFYSYTGMVDLVANPTRITIISSGIYVVTSQFLFNTNGTGIRAIALRKNGTDILWFGGLLPNSVEGSPVFLATTIELAEDDYLEVGVRQNSGSSINVFGTLPYTPEFSVTYIGGIVE